MRPVPGVEGERRLNPKPWDYNFYVMRKLRSAFERCIRAEIPVGSNAVVVDFGCGTRPYEPLFAGRAARYIGIDLADNPHADLTLTSESTIPIADGTADLVLSSQVLEHVVDVHRYLDECSRVARPGGLLLLSTHGFWLYHPYPTDLRRWTWWGLKHEIECHGFTVESIVGCEGPLAYTTQLRLQLLRGFLYQLGAWTKPLISLLCLLSQPLMMAEDLITPRQIRQENSAFYAVAARRMESQERSTKPE
jgi:SAM-dependent methyltransferase